MADVYEGSGARFTELFGRDASAEEDVKVAEISYTDDQIRNAFRETLKIRGSIKTVQDDNVLMGVALEDHNPVHQLKKYAFRYGLSEVLLMGTFEAGLGERVVQSAVDTLRGNEGLRNLRLVGQKSEFVGFIHPGEELEFVVDKTFTLDEIVAVEITGVVKRKRENVPVINITTKLGGSFPKSEAKYAGTVYSRSFLMHPDKLDAYWTAMRQEPSNNVPNILIDNLVPSAMLAFLRDRTGKIDGINTSMKFDYFQEPKPIRQDESRWYHVDLLRARDPVQTEQGYLYKIRAVCSQDGTLISSGIVNCISRQKIDVS